MRVARILQDSESVAWEGSRQGYAMNERELRGLIERASESAAGSVIGSLAYRSDYDSVIAEQRLLQRIATEKNCSFALPLQSDQTLR